MARTFTAIIEPTAVTTAVDFFEITAPATSAVMILEAHLYQTTGLGDAQEEILDLEFVRGDAATSGSGGSTPTPQPIDNGDGAAGSTVEVLNTTRMTAGTGTLDITKKFGWNLRVPLDIIFIPEVRPIITPSDLWTLSLNTAPADSVTIGGTITFVELGG